MIIYTDETLLLYEILSLHHFSIFYWIWMFVRNIIVSFLDLRMEVRRMSNEYSSVLEWTPIALYLHSIYDQRPLFMPPHCCAISLVTAQDATPVSGWVDTTSMGCQLVIVASSLYKNMFLGSAVFNHVSITLYVIIKLSHW